MRPTCSFILVGAALLPWGCTSETETSNRIDVSHNSLGVAALEITKTESSEERVFELRGLNAGDHEVGKVRLRIGSIEDLPSYSTAAGPSRFGSELVLSFGAHSERLVSRETRML